MGWTLVDLLQQVRNTKAPHASSGPSAYAFEISTEKTRHVLYQGLGGGKPDGHIHELYFDTAWHWTDLSANSGAPAALTGPSGYGYNSEGTQHAIFAASASTANLCEIWWKSGDKGFTLISDIDRQHLVTDVPPAASIIFDTQYVFIHGGSDGMIWGAQRDKSADHWQLIPPPPGAPVAGTTAAAISTTNPSKLHVFFFDGTGTMLHFIRTVSSSGQGYVWGQDFIHVPGTALPRAQDFPNAIVPRANWLRVHYNGLNVAGNAFSAPGLHMLLNFGSSWSHENMTAERRLPPPGPGTKPANFINPADRSLHVAYADVNGAIWDFAYANGEGQPVVTNLTMKTSAPAAMPRTSPSGYGFARDGTVHIAYTSSDNRLFEFVLAP